MSVEDLQEALDKFPYKEFHYDPSVINPWIKDFTRKFATYRASLELIVDVWLTKKAKTTRDIWLEVNSETPSFLLMEKKWVSVETVTALLMKLFQEQQAKVSVDRKQLSAKLSIEQTNWESAKGAFDNRKLTQEESQVIEKFGYIETALAYANGRRKLLKELLAGSGSDKP